MQIFASIFWKLNTHYWSIFGASLFWIETALLLGSTVSRSVKDNMVEGVLGYFFNDSARFGGGFGPFDPGTAMFWRDGEYPATDDEGVEVFCKYPNAAVDTEYCACWRIRACSAIRFAIMILATCCCDWGWRDGEQLGFEFNSGIGKVENIESPRGWKVLIADCSPNCIPIGNDNYL